MKPQTKYVKCEDIYIFFVYTNITEKKKINPLGYCGFRLF